jgi:hypothetical protein
MYIYVGVSILILLYSILEEEFEDIKGVNQNPYIEEGQTTQWPKKSTKGQTTIYRTYCSCIMIFILYLE